MNNRKHARVSVDLPVKIYLSGGDSVNARFSDLSEAGAGIVYPVAADPGVVLSLQFQLHGKNARHTINVKGQVMHNFLYHDEYIIGVQFVDISLEQRSLLIAYLSYLRKLRSS